MNWGNDGIMAVAVLKIFDVIKPGAGIPVEMYLDRPGKCQIANQECPNSTDTFLVRLQRNGPLRKVFRHLQPIVMLG